MSLVWRKIQRSNKKAAKFKFTATLQQLQLDCDEKWQPGKLVVAWVHRRRRYTTKCYNWEPSITEPLRGLIVWPNNTENIEIVTTMYKDSRTDAFEDKEWTFVVEEQTPRRNRPIAAVSLNLRLFIHEVPGTQTDVKLKLRSLYDHVTSCVLHLVLTASVIKEGDPLDDDMQSVASVMSVQHQKVPTLAPKAEMDIADLADFDGEFSSSGSGWQPEVREEAATKISEVVTEFEKWKQQHSGDLVPDAATCHKQTDADADAHVDARTQDDSALNASEIESANETGPHDSPVVIRKPKISDVPTVSDVPPVLDATDNRQKPSSNDSGLGVEPKPASEAEESSVNIDPSQDLLSWCQETTAGYRGVKIVNFTSSWRNGLAFCAIIDRHRPDLIHFKSLNHNDIRRNCSRAFDAAAQLGVPRILDANEMVVMAIPDKIGVMTFVHSLRSALTGANNINTTDPDTSRHSILSLSELDAKVLAEFDKLKRHREHTNAIDMSQESVPDPEVFDSVPTTASASDVCVSTPKESSLMTRQELLNPFDDGEGEDVVDEDEDGDQSTSQHNNIEPSLPSPVHSPTKRRASLELQSTRRLSGGSRQEELRRRAKELLKGVSDDSTSPNDNAVDMSPSEEDARKKELLLRARQLISTAETDGAVIRMSDTLPDNRNTHSAPNTTRTTPDIRRNGSLEPSFKLRRSESFETNVNFYQFNRPKPAKTPVHESAPRPSVPALGTSRERLNSPSLVRRPYPLSGEAIAMSETTLDRFKRFGSMRKQELTESINVLSTRIAHTVRSTSVPKELAVLNYSFNKRSQVQQSTSVIASSDQKDPVKLETSWEKELASHNQIASDLEEVNQKQQELDTRAVQVEKKLRQVSEQAAGSSSERELLNEYLSLLNERNLLVRREQYLNIVESIRDYEHRFTLVQHELGQLIQIDDSDKTEAHKIKIDRLMDELIVIVNKKDELVQQLMANEQETEEASEVGASVLSASNNLLAMQAAAGDDKNCRIM